MPDIYDRRSGRIVGTLGSQDYQMLKRFLESQPFDEDLYNVDPEFIEQLSQAGASRELTFCLTQALSGAEQLDLGLKAAE